MLGLILFDICLLLVSGYACWRGGAPERTVAFALVLAAVASTLTPLQATYTYVGLNIPMLRVDLALLAVLLGIALVADRFWPMWLAGLQIVAIGTHGVRVYSPDILPVAYWALSSRIAYPMLFLLAVGTVRHRARLTSGMPEFGWTRERLRHGSDAVSRIK